MKGFIVFSGMIILILLSCNKDRIRCLNKTEKLPNVTMLGKNTFGCLINNHIWNAAISCKCARTIYYTLSGKYDEKNGVVSFSALRWAQDEHENNVNEYLGFNSSPQAIRREGTYFFSLNNRLNGFRLDTDDVLVPGNTELVIADSACLEITRLDTVSNIISGKFHFNAGYRKNNPDYKVTSGRFDFKYNYTN